jgi:putative membrane protein
MIKYDNKNWFSFIFTNTGKHVEGMWLSLIVMGVVTFILVLLDNRFDWFHIDVPPSFHTVLGLVLGLLLVFRTNSAYDRWWEGRKQLGALVNTSRNMAIKLQTYIDEKNYTDKQYAIDLIPAFAFAIKEHLQNDKYENILPFIPERLHKAFLASQHKPNFILAKIAQQIHYLSKEKHILPEELLVLEKEANSLINLLGASERIRNTPIPMAYALHLKRVLLVYCITLPFGFVSTLGWLSIPVVLVVFYTMVGIELIGEEIEDPFGMDENDLPIEELCFKIKTNIDEIKNF